MLGVLPRLCIGLVVVAAALGASAAQADDAQAPAIQRLSWVNPVVGQDFPDPSAVRVDGV